FESPTLPRPLGDLSPWLDHLVVSKEKVFTLLAAQQHRRIIKTHTPLDGIPLVPEATSIVVARDPLDMAVSMYHQGANIDRQRLAELTGNPEVASWRSDRPEVGDWLRSWIAADADPR